MSDSHLDTIKARCAAATPGPWWNETGTIHAPDWRSGAEHGSTCHPAYTFGSNGIDWEADADFIAHARSDIPAMVAEIERLQSELDQIANVVGRLGIRYEALRTIKQQRSREGINR